MTITGPAKEDARGSENESVDVCISQGFTPQFDSYERLFSSILILKYRALHRISPLLTVHVPLLARMTVGEQNGIELRHQPIRRRQYRSRRQRILCREHRFRKRIKRDEMSISTTESISSLGVPRSASECPGAGFDTLLEESCANLRENLAGNFSDSRGNML